MNSDLIEISQADDDDDTLLLHDAVSSLSSSAAVDFSCSPLVRSNPTDEDTWQVRGSVEKENKLSVERQKMKKKKKGFNLRKSLAWNHAFFTDEGVLDPDELSMLNGGLGDPGGEMLSVIDEGRESLSGDIEGDLNDIQEGSDNLLKQLPSSSIKRGQKTTSNVVSASVPSSCSKEKKLSSASAVKRKVLSAHDINRSASKRGGGASLSVPVPSSSLKRPSNLNITKAVRKGPNVSKLSTGKPDQLVNSAANRSSKTSVNPPKCNQKAPPAINPKKNVMKATFTDTKSSTSNVRSGPAVKPILKTSIRPSRNVVKAVSQASTNEHNLTVNATKIHVKSESAVSVSALPPDGHDGTTGRLSVSFGANMRQAQPQAAKPSGLRMPSPSLRFFDQAKSGSSQGLLQKSTQLVQPTDSGVCASKVGHPRPPLPPRKIPAVLDSGSSIVATIDLNSLEKLKSNLEVNNAQKVGVNISCKSQTFDEKINEQQVSDVYDVGPQSPDVAKLAEPCKVENKDAKLKNSELLFHDTEYTGSHQESTELVLPETKNPNLTRHIDDSIEVKGLPMTKSMSCHEKSLDTQSMDMNNSSDNLNDRMGYMDEQSEEHSREAFTGSHQESTELVLPEKDNPNFKRHINDSIEVKGLPETKSMSCHETCLDTQCKDMNNASNNLNDRMGCVEEQSEEHAKLTETVPHGINSRSRMNSPSLEVSGLSETKSMTQSEICEDTQSIDMDICSDESTSEVYEDLPGEMHGMYEQFHEQAKLIESNSREVCSISIMNIPLLPVNDDILFETGNREELSKGKSLEVADCSVQAKVCTPSKPELSCSLSHCKDLEHRKDETTGIDNLSCDMQQDVGNAPVLCSDENIVNGSGRNTLSNAAADNPLSMIMDDLGDKESEKDGYQDADSCQAAQCVTLRDPDPCKRELKKMNNPSVITDTLNGMYEEDECSNTCVVTEEEKGLPFADQQDNNASAVKSVSSEETNSDKDELKSPCILGLTPLFEKDYGVDMNGEINLLVESAPSVNDVNQEVQIIKPQLLEASTLGLERTDGDKPMVTYKPVLVVNNSYEESTPAEQETDSSVLHNVCSTGSEMGNEIQQSLEEDKMMITDCSHDINLKNQSEDAHDGLWFDDARSTEDLMKAENVIISETIAAGATGSVIPHVLCQVQRTEEASQLTVKETSTENSQVQLYIEDSLKAENVIISETIAVAATGSEVPHVSCQVQRTEEASQLTVEETPMENLQGQFSHESLLADRCNSNISSSVENTGYLMVPDNMYEQPGERPVLENPHIMTGQIYEESHGLSSDNFLLHSEISLSTVEDVADGGNDDILEHSNSCPTELETLNICSLQTPAMQGSALEVERKTESMDGMMISGSLEVELSVENVDLIMVGECEADGKHRSHEPSEFESPMNNECQDPAAENGIADKVDNGASSTDIMQGGEAGLLHSKTLVVEDETLAVEECTHQSDLQYETDNATEDKNVTASSSKESVNEKRNAPVIKPPPNLVPFSDEWLAALEAAGEEVLTMKSGAVQNSPPDKTQPEPSPWSPVKRKKNQGIGPYDCTKYTNTGIPPSTSSS